VDPNAEADAAEARRFGRARAIRNHYAQTRSDIPRAPVLGLRGSNDAGTAQGESDHGEQGITFHSESPFAWFSWASAKPRCGSQLITPHHIGCVRRVNKSLGSGNANSV